MNEHNRTTPKAFTEINCAQSSCNKSLVFCFQFADYESKCIFLLSGDLNNELNFVR